MFEKFKKIIIFPLILALSINLFNLKPKEAKANPLVLAPFLASDFLIDLFGTAAVIVTIESGVKVLSGDDAIFYGNQLQSSIDYLECTDSNGNIYYVDHNGKMYDENYIPINTVTDSTSISITGAKINTATFVEKLQAIIDKLKGLKMKMM